LPHSALVQTLQALIEELPFATLAADNTGRYVAANTAATTLTGYSHDELLRLTVKDLTLTPSMQQEPFGEVWKRFIQSGSQAGDYVLVRKDGATVAVHYAAFASVAPGVHVSMLTPLELPSSI
jgi:PAS domain S-box-containing protein